MSSVAFRQESLRRVTSHRSFRIATKTKSTRSINNEENEVEEVPKSKWELWKEDYMHHALKLLGCIVFYVVCVWFYSSQLGWSVADCIYFITVSITTVGYGKEDMM